MSRRFISIITVLLGLAAVLTFASPVLASPAPPCTPGAKCVTANLNVTATVNAEETLSLSAATLDLGSYNVGQSGSSPMLSTGPAAEVATVTSFDSAGYALDLYTPQWNSTLPDGYFQGANLSTDQQKMATNLQVERTATTGNWVPWSTNATAQAQIGLTAGISGGANCTSQPGCTGSGSNDVWSFGLQMNMSGAPADSYSAPFVVYLAGQ
jgi:hypothetical protein